VENRPWRTSYRGPFLIHAGKQWWGDDVDWINEVLAADYLGEQVPAREDLAFGAIVGVARLTAVIDNGPRRVGSQSPWASPDSPYHWCVEDATMLEGIEVSGAQGWWWLDTDTLGLDGPMGTRARRYFQNELEEALENMGSSLSELEP
jgi:hypothetical protein